MDTLQVINGFNMYFVYRNRTTGEVRVYWEHPVEGSKLKVIYQGEQARKFFRSKTAMRRDINALIRKFNAES